MGHGYLSHPLSMLADAQKTSRVMLPIMEKNIFKNTILCYYSSCINLSNHYIA